jgi:membrane protease YdiL (CAAX protease family)
MYINPTEKINYTPSRHCEEEEFMLDETLIKQKGKISVGRENSRSLYLFFVLVTLISIPFYLIGFVVDGQIIKGLPISSIMIIAPFSAAIFLTYKKFPGGGVKELIKKSVDFNNIKSIKWLLLDLVFMPGSMALAFGVMKLLNLPLPEPIIPLTRALILFPTFLFAATLEEIGWTGYILEILEKRWGEYRSGLFLGAFWALWHFVPFIHVQRSLYWIGWQSLFLVVMRVAIVWIFYRSGKSVFGAILFHAAYNMASFLFPNLGSHYDPRIACLVTIPIVMLMIHFGRRQKKNQIQREDSRFS